MFKGFSEFDVQIASVLLGVILAQGVNFGNDWLKRRKIKKALLDELIQLRMQLNIASVSLERGIQVFAKGGLIPNKHVIIEGHIFSNSYKDAAMYLNVEQRISFQLIHSLIAELNSTLRQQAATVDRAVEKEELDVADYEQWGRITKSAYRTGRQIIWHIHFHLENIKNPSLDYGGPIHESYLKFLQKIEDEIDSIENSAEGLDREGFERLYDPDRFKGGYENVRE